MLDYFLKHKEFNNIDESRVEEGLKSMERILNVTFNKSGGTSSRNGVTTRLTLPTSWVKELGLTEENREVIAKLEDGKITIEPKK